ncbi:MAG TPA: dethiobiotin synthase [Burkholderiales bacterium]|jgi:dethiobiotin synthetase|nr:dethiobiotin synthase [Burkholderiales bacterium]
MKTGGYFVTGTDTGVGKTLVSCALLHAFASRGRRAIGMKPVASGCERVADEWRNEDVENLIAASGVSAPRELINPYHFVPPIAPHIAAAQVGESIELARIETAFAALARVAGTVIVEGVGGFYVPLNAREDTADLACRLALPVILVVGLRLGCLNHALLTAAAIRARGLTIAGWIANGIDPDMDDPAQNIAALDARIAAPRLAHIPRLATADWRRAAEMLDATVVENA